MNPVKVLLLDLSPKGKLSTKLRKILESSPSLSVNVLQESVKAWEVHKFETNFSHIVKFIDPALIVLVLSPGLLKESDELLQFLGTKAGDLPMVVFIGNRNNAATMIVELRHWTVDFIPSPLTAVNVLPLIWQLVSNIS